MGMNQHWQLLALAGPAQQNPLQASLGRSEVLWGASGCCGVPRGASGCCGLLLVAMQAKQQLSVLALISIPGGIQAGPL